MDAVELLLDIDASVADESWKRVLLVCLE